MEAAVMLGRQGEDDVANALDLTNMCQAFQCLPRSGGLYDQDCFDVYRMRAVVIAQGKKSEKERQEQEARIKVPRR